MSHVDSGGGGVSGMTGSGAGVSSAHKKLRRKRKELDALVAEDKLRRKSSSASRHDLLHSDSDEVEFNGRRTDMGAFFGRGGLLGCLPGVCALLILVTTAVGVAATLRLLMATRRDLDTLQMRLNSVEASGSELPAKFHESHVRLQQLEKNHSSLWTSLTTITGDLSDVTDKLNKLEISVKILQESLAGSPQLTSLPKDVASIQGSVATFGSTLQDVQSAVKALKEEQSSIHTRVDAAVASVTTLTTEVQQIYNSTRVPNSGGREGEKSADSIAVAFLSLKNQVSDLSSSVSSVNASVSKLFGPNSDESKVKRKELFYNSSIDNISKRINEVEKSCSQLEKENLSSHIANITTDVSILKESSDRHYKLLQNITQNVAVVKGVEKKLEGSQLQMASGVSDLKQQLQMLERRFSSINSSPTTSSPSQSGTMRIKKREVLSSNSGSFILQRRKRGIP